MTTYNYNIVAKSLAINLATGNSLTVTQTAPNLIFTLSPVGIFTPSMGGDLALSGDGTNAITIPVANLTTSLIVTNTGAGLGTNNVTFNGVNTLITTMLKVTITHSTNLATGKISFTSGTIVMASSLIMIETGLNIIIDANSKLKATGSGSVTLSANMGMTPTTGSFNGVTVTGIGTEVSCSGSGNLTVSGRGGGGVGSDANGVSVTSSGAIQGGTTGTLIVTGTGGTSNISGRSRGVFVDNGSITSLGGTVEVNGTGGGTGTADSNFGVFVTSINGRITAGSTGSVNVTGTGGLGSGGFNDGVRVGDQSMITSSGGMVTVTGTSGQSMLRDNRGVRVITQGIISAGGDGSVFVTGTGTTGGTRRNTGVLVDSMGMITSNGGSVTVTGTGGISSGPLSVSNHGVVVSDAVITAGGMGEVIVTGKGGSSGDSDDYGVFLLGGVISSSGGAVTVTGTGGKSTGGNIGVLVSRVVSKITSGGGAVTVTGTGGISTSAMGGGNHGVAVDKAGVVSSTQVGSLFVTGMAVNGALSYGIELTGSNSLIRSDMGNITLTGNSLDSLGVVQELGGQIMSTSGSVTISDNGGYRPATTGLIPDVDLVSSSAILTLADSTLAVEITSSSVYTALALTGKLSLSSTSRLQLTGLYVPISGDIFTIVDNRGSDAITGIFLGLPEGSLIPFNNQYLQITYQGGIGSNDVVLRRFDPASVTPEAYLTALKALQTHYLSLAVYLKQSLTRDECISYQKASGKTIHAHGVILDLVCATDLIAQLILEITLSGTISSFAVKSLIDQLFTTLVNNRNSLVSLDAAGVQISEITTPVVYYGIRLYHSFSCNFTDVYLQQILVEPGISLNLA